MNHFKLLLGVLLVFIFSNCSKSGSGNGNVTPINYDPTNLNITSAVSTDSKGNVAFTATAGNTINYSYDFGDGGTYTNTNGSVEYKYAATGTYTVTVTAKGISGKSISKTTSVAVTVNLTLQWADEFNTAGSPDTTKWKFDIGTGVNGWGNNELEYYTNRTDNAVVANGFLNITAKKEAYSGSSYTSAKLLSYGKYAFKYGYMEFRAQLPSVTGAWPGLWMLGNNYFTAGWPACGEIDVTEQTANTPNTIYGTLHYVGNNPGSTTTIATSQSAFHTYGLEWSASEIKILADNVVYFSFANTASTPFNQNFYIILNQAVGGTFGGSVDPNFTTSVMQIDYVRVYN